MYYRRWTRIDKLALLRIKYERDMLTNERHLVPLLKIHPKLEQTSQYQKEEYLNDYRLMKKMFKHYPDLKYLPIRQYFETGVNDSSQSDIAMSFLQKWKRLIKDGYAEDVAFQKTEKLYQEKITNKINDLRLNEMLVYNNRARSFLNTSKQYAELEARLKVERMERDLALYKISAKKHEDSMRKKEELKSFEASETANFEDDLIIEPLESLDAQNEEFEDEATDITEEDLEAHKPQDDVERSYVRVLHKIVSRLSPKVRTINKEKRIEIVEEFLRNTKNLFRAYYKRAATFDKLSGLRNDQIVQQLMTSPKKIKKYTRDLRKQLHKYNIKLDANGEVDFSECPHAHVVEKLKSNPYVKMALMLEDLKFEFPYLEVQQQLARRIKSEFQVHQEKAQKAYEQSEEYKELNEEERLERERQEASQSAYDKEFGFRYSDVTEKKKEVAPGEEANAEELAERKAKYQQLLETEKDLFEEDTASFKMFETIQEKRHRLEKRWLQSRLSALEGGVDKPTFQEQKEAVNQAIDKLRRVKYRVDQIATKNAQKLFFDEHNVFSRDEIMVDMNDSYEKVEQYLRQPEQVRKATPKDEAIDDKITRMMMRTEIVEDTLEPFKDWRHKKINEHDSIDYQEFVRIEKELQFAESLQSTKTQGMEETLGLEDNPDEKKKTQESEKGGKKGKKGEPTDVKKKLLDYIKRVPGKET
mmetsp:Transcript_75356/g.87570  ORF Transcript_75356/g.87570 Transcript_75356/m.87570 type:complete len:700 (-) Transcript_75356:153-2252(-)